MLIGIVSGYFNPIGQNHLDYLKDAWEQCNKLIVIVNNDQQALLKKGYTFQDEVFRCNLMSKILECDEVILSIDTDLSVSKTIEQIYNEHKDLQYPGSLGPPSFAFFNGGDVKEIREKEVCERLGIEVVFGVGGNDKVTSSTQVLERFLKIFGLDLTNAPKPL